MKVIRAAVCALRGCARGCSCSLTLRSRPGVRSARSQRAAARATCRPRSFSRMTSKRALDTRADCRWRGQCTVGLRLGSRTAAEAPQVRAVLGQPDLRKGHLLSGRRGGGETARRARVRPGEPIGPTTRSPASGPSPTIYRGVLMADRRGLPCHGHTPTGDPRTHLRAGCEAMARSSSAKSLRSARPLLRPLRRRA